MSSSREGGFRGELADKMGEQSAKIADKIFFKTENACLFKLKSMNILYYLNNGTHNSVSLTKKCRVTNC